MRLRVLSLVLGLIAFAGLASCSSSESDSVSDACGVLVNECHRIPSMSECIDDIGNMDPACLDCIAASGCGFASCQRSPVGCRLPLYLMP